MRDRIPKFVPIAAVIAVPVLLTFLAYTSPGYFTSQTYLAGLLFMEIMIAAIWMFKRAFFPLILVAFLFAGANLPVGSGWVTARWVTLGVGASVGLLMMLRERRHALNFFHLLALFAVLSALVSACVSRYASISFFKVAGLFSLFLYAATGARIAVIGRENQFFSDLLLGCEVFVGLVAAAYVVGIEAMGNPNSLGAVMGVVAAPLLLWGTLVSTEQFQRRRRAALFAISASLIFVSHARAAMVAAFVSCALLCIAMRRYRLLMQGVVVIVIVAASSAILRPEAYSDTVSTFTNTIVFKAKNANGSIFESRESPWQSAMESIRTHFWFGTGFGTSDSGKESNEYSGNFSSTSASSTEFGSSYLAITTWVGILGVAPFLALMLVLLQKIFRTFRWMVRTGSANHPAIPLAMVMLAGMIHAGFEDWMFASGYYVTVFYWSMAFVFVDEAPSPMSAAPPLRGSQPAAVMRPDLSFR
ncbi:MAG TPA: O-antigen ligase family protein [Candidatus Sulfotelmatobacter sp.]